MNPEYIHPQADTSIQGFPIPELLPGARAIIWLDITRVGTSCGYAVPFMKFESHRTSPFPPTFRLQRLILFRQETP